MNVFRIRMNHSVPWKSINANICIFLNNYHKTFWKKISCQLFQDFFHSNASNNFERKNKKKLLFLWESWFTSNYNKRVPFFTIFVAVIDEKGHPFFCTYLYYSFWFQSHSFCLSVTETYENTKCKCNKCKQNNFKWHL